MTNVMIENYEDLRAEIVGYQGVPMMNLSAAAKGTIFESNVRSLAGSLATLNKSVGAREITLEQGIGQYNRIVQLYNDLVDSVANYGGTYNLLKMSYAELKLVPSKALDYAADLGEKIQKKIPNLAPSLSQNWWKYALYAGGIIGGFFILKSVLGDVIKGYLFGKRA